MQNAVSDWIGILRIIKILFLMVAIPFALAVAWIAWVFFEIEVLYPLKFTSLQDEAEAWNKENWESGYALRVTVQVSSDRPLGGETAIAVIDCYERRFTYSGNLKGPPRSSVATISDGLDYLTLPFGPDAMHSTRLHRLCTDALRDSDRWQLPHVTESQSYWSSIVANDRSLSCFLGNDPRTTRGEVTRPTIVDLEKVPLRELFSLEAYRALPNRSNEAHVAPPLAYYWWTENVATECWRRKTRDNCSEEVAAICGTPLR